MTRDFAPIHIPCGYCAAGVHTGHGATDLERKFDAEAQRETCKAAWLAQQHAAAEAVVRAENAETRELERAR